MPDSVTRFLARIFSASSAANMPGLELFENMRSASCSVCLDTQAVWLRVLSLLKE